jgi:hypothetical protein
MAEVWGDHGCLARAEPLTPVQVETIGVAISSSILHVVTTRTDSRAPVDAAGADRGMVGDMPKRSPLRASEVNDIVRRYRMYESRGYGVTEATQAISDALGVPFHTVYAVKRRFAPTTDAAAAYINANALRLASVPCGMRTSKRPLRS